MKDEKFITVDGLAKQLGVHRITILRRVAKGVYPPFVGDTSYQRGRAWPKTYWDNWFKNQAANANKTQRQLVQAVEQN
jgi:hypothetical protein